MYNTNGQEVIRQAGDANKIKNTIAHDSNNLPLSLYMVKLITNDGRVIVSDKIIYGK